MFLPGWQTRTISGKVADVFEPTHAAEPSRAIIFLHGHGCVTLRENDVFTREFERHGLRVVCPHGERSWWLPIVCREFDPVISPMEYIRTQLLGWIRETWRAAPPAIAVLGVSMGGQGALQLAYRHPNEFPVVAALSPVIDLQDWYGRGIPLDEMFSDAEAVRQQSVTLQVQGLNWPRHQWLACDSFDLDVRPGLERLLSKLNSSGIPFESDLTAVAGGHSWDYFNHMAPAAVRFLVEGLAREERRLV